MKTVTDVNTVNQLLTAEKAAKKRAEKSAERKEMGDYTLSVTGTDVKSMTQSLVAGSVSIYVHDRSSFDIKA